MKNRLLNPVNTVHLFILQVLNENTPLNDLPHKSGESFTGSASCKARKRLPLGVFQRLLRRLADTLLPHCSGEATDDQGRWYGHRVFIMDGSSCSMPDTGEVLFVRRITVVLDKPTRDGDGEIHIPTNLPRKDAKGEGRRGFVPQAVDDRDRVPGIGGDAR